MQWSPEQDAALKKIDAWIKDPNGAQVMRMFGFAGTGKTTLAKEIAANVAGDVYFGTFTGKAAHVLRQKGCHNATTIHSLIYNPRDKSQKRLKQLEAELASLVGALQIQGASQWDIDNNKQASDLRAVIKEEKNNLSRPMFQLNAESVIRTAALTIIDECSMVDEIIGKDLESFGTKILVQGDPAQLPPVKGEGYFMSDRPEIMLTEIHRQARDNPIIQMATVIRNGGSLKLGSYGSSRVIDRTTPDDALGADQMIVGKNATRHSTNDRTRSLLGFEGRNPQPRDKVVCLRNNHEQGLLNGAIWYVKEIIGQSEDDVIMAIQPSETIEGGELTVTSHIHHFHGREKELNWWQKRDAEEFDFGYALTCHKAQGSQWDNVMIFDESKSFRQDAHRWLYTAVTRAAEKVTVVKV